MESLIKEALRQIRSKLASPKETSPLEIGGQARARPSPDDAPTENFSQ